MSRKGKEVVQSTDSGPTKWDQPLTKVFLDLLIAWKKKHIGTIKWDKIGEEFKQLTGSVFTSQKLKTKHDNMKQNWQLFNRLNNAETGLGINPETGTIDASDDWWAARIAENPLYKKFRTAGLPLLEEQDQLWGGKNATGDECIAPATANDGLEDFFGDDCYTPQVPTQTDLDDVDDIHSTGHSPLKTTTPGQESITAGKRARTSGPERNGKKKKGTSENAKTSESFQNMVGLVSTQTEEQRAYFTVKKEYYEAKKTEKYIDPTYEQAVHGLVELDIAGAHPEIFYYGIELFNTNSQRLLFLALPHSARFGYLERLWKKSVDSAPPT